MLVAKKTSEKSTFFSSDYMTAAVFNFTGATSMLLYLMHYELTTSFVFMLPFFLVYNSKKQT